MLSKQLLIALVIFIIAPLVSAVESDFIQWHKNNVQLLSGGDYKLGSEQRTIMTLEHVNGWQYGDFFIFGEKIWSDKGKSTYYIEPTLRFSLSKMLDKKISYGLIKDVLISTQIEKPKNQDVRRLAGFLLILIYQGLNFLKVIFLFEIIPIYLVVRIK